MTGLDPEWSSLLRLVRSHQLESLLVITLLFPVTYICKHVIVTIPLGVLKKHHTTLFSPQLPSDKVQALADMREGRICKIFLDWSRPWWTSHSTPINLGERRRVRYNILKRYQLFLFFCYQHSPFESH